MHRNHILYLSDPLSNKNFNITIFEEKNSHIISGALMADNNWYPIINGVPRILVGKLKTRILQEHWSFYKKYKEKIPKNIADEWDAALENISDFDAFLRHQKKTAESFAFEWKYIYKENDFEENNFFHFLHPFVKKEDLKDKITLDIGCGSGRFTKWAALSGTKGSFATDLRESVE